MIWAIVDFALAALNVCAALYPGNKESWLNWGSAVLIFGMGLVMLAMEVAKKN